MMHYQSFHLLGFFFNNKFYSQHLFTSAEGSSPKELSTTMLVLGIWAQKGSAGQKVLENLGFNEDKIAELAATVSILLGS